ncbi:hypothetical protein N665_0012s0249 [Sinapis alba]|nr:hypothetical protein N665_0012s0249 [Sinapis alba]
MEQDYICSGCYQYRVFSLQEALDWRVLARSDFLTTPFVNCT